MVNRHTAKKIRKIHRYLGIFIGIQFLFWTISGLYFSWSNIDDIHGDQFRNKQPVSASFTNLISPKELERQPAIQTIELKEINKKPYYWINEKYLYNASTGILKNGITKEEALIVARRYMMKNIEVMDVQLISKVGEHHEYREKMLPVYVISYKNQENVKAYISKNNGAFQAVRHRNWRVFDFLWMTHTMDYKNRDNFNTLVLRAFSLLGLITVFSGFLLWYISSPTVRKIKK